MFMWLFILLIFSSSSFGSENLLLRVNEQGILKILKLAIKYNTGSDNSKSLVIPSNVYRFTLSKDQLASNSLVQLASQVTLINPERDLPIYLQTSEIKITGTIDKKSLRTEISHITERGFDVNFSISLPSIVVTSDLIGLCETKLKNQNKCGRGLKATASSVRISTVNHPVVIRAKLRVSFIDDRASVRVVNVRSNLESTSGPTLQISVGKIDIPPVSIVINGVETPLDLSHLQREILKQRTFLATKLLDFAADFVTYDLTDMINHYLSPTSLPTSQVVYSVNNNSQSDEVPFIDIQHPPQDGIAHRAPLLRYVLPPPSEIKNRPFSEILQEEFKAIIKTAQLGLRLKKIQVPNGKDLQLSGLFSMMLNGKKMTVSSKLSNRPVTNLPVLDLSAHRHHDLSLAISEPVINSALEAVNQTGLLREIFSSVNDVLGLSFKGVHVHFTQDKNLKVVLQLEVDLSKTEASNMKQWAERKAGVLLESFNNGAKIYFPLEIPIAPEVIQGKDGVKLKLNVGSPFVQGKLANTFYYPSNVSAMTSIVRESFFKKLKEGYSSTIFKNKKYLDAVDISKFFNHSKVVFTPKSLSLEKGAYFLINLDVEKILFTNMDMLKR
jgi:hypothetical protein